MATRSGRPARRHTKRVLFELGGPDISSFGMELVRTFFLQRHRPAKLGGQLAPASECTRSPAAPSGACAVWSLNLKQVAMHRRSKKRLVDVALSATKMKSNLTPYETHCQCLSFWRQVEGWEGWDPTHTVLW